MIRVLVESIARRIKGAGYKFDPDLPISAILLVGFRRFFGLFRCVALGVKIHLIYESSFL